MRRNVSLHGIRLNKYSWRSCQSFIESRAPLKYLDKTLPIFMPYSGGKKYWDILILIFVVYNSILVPFEAGFGLEKPGWLQRMENIVDACFFADILFSLRTSYVDSQGNMIRDSMKIAKQYFRTWFPIDVVASIPFEFVAVVVGMNGSGHLTLLAFLKTPRLLRLGRLMRFFDRMKNANVFRIVRLILLMCLIAHWIACTWRMLYIFSPAHIHWRLFDDDESIATQYMETYYRSFLLMVGDNVEPNNNVERSFCCVVLVLGACFYATVVGNMALLVNNLNATSARHNKRKDVLQDAVRYIGAPDDIQFRIQEYFDYLSKYAHPGPEGMALLSELPRSLFEDVSMWLYRDQLTGIPLFKGCEANFITQLATRVHLEVYMPREVVFQLGDIGREMQIIMKGKVAVINKHKEMVSMLMKSDFFGDIALLTTSRRTATCVALTHCDLAVLSGYDLQMAMKDFEESAKIVQKRARDRLIEAECFGGLTQSTPEQNGFSKERASGVDATVESSARRVSTVTGKNTFTRVITSRTISQEIPAAPKSIDTDLRSTVSANLRKDMDDVMGGENNLQLHRWVSSMSEPIVEKTGPQAALAPLSETGLMNLTRAVEKLTDKIRVIENKIDNLDRSDGIFPSLLPPK
ncbi:hypothetical protein BSKO_07736 [Bryopsis sp. KO-2023]|nr:hypothetical protein BSKO_07736 [Bryopsis sp. KO-2023]